MGYKFKVVFDRESDGGYSVHVPALPGCVSQGDTFEEANVNVQEALKLYLWSLKDDGLPVLETDAEVLIRDIEVIV